ncbi:aldo/keto reductase [Cryptosporangium aurantiacum]|uniref:Predicted oxidoreductase n=1 Tax=Cryptosporangium aurantiacum TaxID=134849 RepID=A0A1M7QMA6_9ACTN|nr:aldo/keto reductase [Cryptosporangium aurantiacum]SHN32139.1 Predicted oxidoreductase [Cryptosporangium aurantiacum]
MAPAQPRTLGRSGIDVSALGLGCWAIGGTWTFLGSPGGWSAVDDEESVRALRRAHELGITFFDTAANYGAGHSEVILGRAFAGHRDDVVLATKFGYRVDEAQSAVSEYPVPDPDLESRIRSELAASLRRLGTDYIDVYQLHVGDLPAEEALRMVDVLVDLVREGSIRTWGWSTDDVASIRAVAEAPGFSVVQHGLSVLGYEDPAMLALCDEFGLGSINRSPLAMGALTGKFTPTTTFADDDQRRRASWHPAFADGRPTADWLARLDAVRDVLTSDGRTLAQGALAWIWGRSPRTVPIPGFKTVAQVEENARALEKGPLTAEQMDEVARIVNGAPVG